MGKLNESGLKAQIKSGELSNVYLIYGDENYLKEFYIGKLKKKIVDPAFADFNFHSHEGKDSSIDDIIMDAQMLPMMSEYSLVLVHDYPLDKNKSDIDKLKEFFKDIPESCVLVFWLDSIDVDVKKNSKWNTIINSFAKAGEAVNLEKRTEAELVKLIVASAKKRGCSIDSSKARYFIGLVGSDIQTLFNELEKICAYVQQGEITREHIDKLAVKSLQARVFDLSRCILSGDADSAYNILFTLFAQKEEPIGILSVIASCYIDMYRVKCAKEAGKSENDVGNFYMYKGREWLLRNAARDSYRISLNSLREALDILGEADELMKSSAIDKNLLLEETVAKLLKIR